MTGKRLYRSRTDRKLTGLCGGIAHFLGIDSTLVRIGLVLLTMFTGFPILLYFLLALLVPKEPYWASAFPDSVQHYHDLDHEIERLEKRALQQEVSRLRAELAKYKQA
ncbi:PspC domain-containing protein [Brevibacillus sp. SYP-B805]|uniref:PspC domain-containing protein n=1 Tax=Brevibacillus sp. SYP-B805 TaxID=1578199 RepID=UPI0013EC7F5B|nr:PspC domain-containing protein [Brevibacillus sp. SYP-B805]NGQ95360.1 PspC domain-containing protein [Brevibacillus sp. SYP-B805]